MTDKYEVLGGHKWTFIAQLWSSGHLLEILFQVISTSNALKVAVPIALAKAGEEDIWQYSEDDSVNYFREEGAA